MSFFIDDDDVYFDSKANRWRDRNNGNRFTCDPSLNRPRVTPRPHVAPTKAPAGAPATGTKSIFSLANYASSLSSILQVTGRTLVSSSVFSATEYLVFFRGTLGRQMMSRKAYFPPDLVLSQKKAMYEGYRRYREQEGKRLCEAWKIVLSRTVQPSLLESIADFNWMDVIEGKI